MPVARNVYISNGRFCLAMFIFVFVSPFPSVRVSVQGPEFGISSPLLENRDPNSGFLSIIPFSDATTLQKDVVLGGGVGGLVGATSSTANEPANSGVMCRTAAGIEQELERLREELVRLQEKNDVAAGGRDEGTGLYDNIYAYKHTSIRHTIYFNMLCESRSTR